MHFICLEIITPSDAYLKRVVANMSIRRIDSYAQVDPIPSEAWVGFDLDDTVFIQKDRIIRNHYPVEREALLEAVRAHHGDGVAARLFLDAEYQVIEDALIHLMSRLHAQGNSTFGFTARTTGALWEGDSVEEASLQCLDALGIQFQSPLQDLRLPWMNNDTVPDWTLEWHYRSVPNSDVCVHQGVLFTNNLDKGHVFEAVIKTLDLAIPSQLVMFDDKLDNLVSLRAMCERLGILFTGYHYRHVDHLHTGPLDPTMVAIQIEAGRRHGILLPEDHL